jgi:predicted metal-binding protein
MIKRLGSFHELIDKSRKLGASDAGIISAQSLVIEDRFADMCSTPNYQCPGYGQSPHCPPYAWKPGEFRDILNQYEHVLVFKIDTPTEVLLDDTLFDIAKLIHGIAAGIELLAIEKDLSMPEDLLQVRAR